MVVDWFSAVMWCAIRMSNSLISGASESACPVESVNEEVCCARTFIGFLYLGAGQYLRRDSSEAATHGGRIVLIAPGCTAH